MKYKDWLSQWLYLIKPSIKQIMNFKYDIICQVANFFTPFAPEMQTAYIYAKTAKKR